LVVDGGHRLYFAEYGCRDAPAAVVLHGGPGSGCNTGMLDWFDLSRQRVVLFDQRGAGRSAPSALLAHNCTRDLILDIERLRQHLRIERWLAVGGSWGATLGILYAGCYPDRLTGLVLRGTFLASVREITWFFQSLKALVPDAWGRLTCGWAPLQKQDVLQSLTSLLHNGTPDEQRDAAARWGGYEADVMQAMTGVEGSKSERSGEARLGKYLLQSHYLSQRCFVTERQLLRSARNTARVPTIMIHVRRRMRIACGASCRMPNYGGLSKDRIRRLTRPFWQR
jgi:proline iminopeptidase